MIVLTKEIKKTDFSELVLLISNNYLLLQLFSILEINIVCKK